MQHIPFWQLWPPECKLQGTRGRGERQPARQRKWIFPQGVFYEQRFYDDFNVRRDAVLLEHLGPLVRKCNVALDLSRVERIDAAGITALILLYRSACESGHRFSLTNVSARVAQILAVVGLDRILLSHNAVQNSHFGPRLRRPAA